MQLVLHLESAIAEKEREYADEDGDGDGVPCHAPEAGVRDPLSVDVIAKALDQQELAASQDPPQTRRQDLAAGRDTPQAVLGKNGFGKRGPLDRVLHIPEQVEFPKLPRVKATSFFGQVQVHAEEVQLSGGEGVKVPALSQVGSE